MLILKILLVFASMEIINLQRSSHPSANLSSTPSLLATISYIGKQYEISFDVFPSPHDYSWLGDVYYKDRIHGNQSIWFTGGVHEDRMHICLPNYGHEVFCYSKKREKKNQKEPKTNGQEKWVNIRISQMKYGKIYVFTIDVDGQEEFRIVNRLPREYKRIRVMLEERTEISTKEKLLRNFRVLKTRPLESCLQHIVGKRGKNVRRSNLLYVLPSLKKWFDISLEFKVTSLCASQCNILAFVTGSHRRIFESVIPALFILPNRSKGPSTGQRDLIFSTCVGRTNNQLNCGSSSFVPRLHQWVSLKITQSKFGAKTFLKISMNGYEVDVRETPEPREITNVEVYASAPHFSSVQGVIRNMKVDERCPMNPHTVTWVPQNGNWGSWVTQEECTKTCGGGTRIRIRYCNKPSPANGGRKCLQKGGKRAEKEKELTTCNEQDCPLVDGDWGQWSMFGSCNKTCGGGHRTRTRMCTDPSPKGGLECLISDSKNIRRMLETQFETCNTHACPVHGGWGKWKWSTPCSETCGRGTRLRVRTCNNPIPMHKGLYCLKSDGNGKLGERRGIAETQVQSCNALPCPIHGGWTEWSMSKCSKECGGGITKGRRVCRRPLPSHGGDMCLMTNGVRGMEQVTERICNAHKCPIDGGWAEWKTSKCSKECGGGIMVKWRYCNKPLPLNEGKLCLKSIGGRGTEEVIELSCNTHKCPIHGGWTDWDMSQCSKKCNGGIARGKRTCRKPLPQYGGQLCLKSDGTPGSEELTETACNTHECPINGGWTDWNMSICSKKCNGGILKGKRTCSKPLPLHGGQLCLKSDGTRGLEELIERACNIHGGWTGWDMSKCSKKCNGGIAKGKRTCSKPLPLHGGKLCMKSDGTQGMEEHTERACNIHKCPIHGGWTDWDMSVCSKECNGGIAKGKRICANPLPLHGGQLCLKSDGTRGIEDLTKRACNTHKCAIHGGWTDWDMSKCSKECNGGIEKGKRTCSKPLPLHGGKLCMKSDGTQGMEEHTERACNIHKCPIHGGWTDWDMSVCSKECNGGIAKGKRICANPLPLHGGQLCLKSDGTRGIEDLMERACNTHKCAIHGGWTNWDMSKCSKECDGGIEKGKRTCSKPLPLHGGDICLMLDGRRGMEESIERRCNTHKCPIHGGWSIWKISKCSRECGGGTMVKWRYCNNPLPLNRGEICLKSDGERGTEELIELACNIQKCPINGGWSKWALSKCSKKCNKGTMKGKRVCNNPLPRYGGKLCLKSNGNRGTIESIRRSCNVHKCPVHGGWTDWDISQCSKECNGGTAKRKRICSKPLPLHGGQLCLKSNGIRGIEELAERACNTHRCPVHGGWTDWDISKCSKKCNGGIAKGKRTCKKPPPLHGGESCLKSDGTRGIEEFTARSCNIQKCPIHGGWTEWNMSKCSKECDGGITTGKRTCSKPLPLHGGDTCRKLDGSRGMEEGTERRCNTHKCPIHGGWSKWNISKCSKKCGGGKLVQWRYCSKPDPLHGGELCLRSVGGRGTEEVIEITCNTYKCPINGGWSKWVMSKCSKKCNKGWMKGKRVCNNPLPLYGGKSCLKSDGSRGTKELIKRSCNVHKCPVHGGWTDWDMSQCSKKCNGGVAKGKRTCSKPLPLHGGQLCLKSDGTRGLEELTERACNIQKCPIHGGWTEWNMSKCSKECNVGITKGKRFCKNPLPMHGGDICLKIDGSRGMEEVTERKCNTHKCPIHGGWSKWKTAKCSKECGGGIRVKWRYCNSPLALNGGKLCLKSVGARGAEELIEISCNTHNCPIHGGWSKWMMSECSKKCNAGTIKGKRICNNPVPLYGGNFCLKTDGHRGKEESVERTCNVHKCPVHGGWTDWDISQCSKECNGGITKRKRTCSKPLPLHGGDLCLKSDGTRGIEEVTESGCNVHQCPIHGGWADWNMSECSKECNGGVTKGKRTCSKPLPMHGGELCLKSDGTRGSEESIERACNIHQCPVHGRWSEWNMSKCSKECEGGVSKGKRTCSKPLPLHDGDICVKMDGSRGMEEITERECNTHRCPINGGWTKWKTSKCSKDCGGGIMTKWRICSNPLPEYGGKSCLQSVSGTEGTEEQIELSCNIHKCPIHGGWNTWVMSKCSKKCNGGVMKGRRTCNNPSPSHGGALCLKSDGSRGLKEEIQRVCNTHKCPVHGSWTEWNMSKCSKECNGGITRGTRTCNKPLPLHGGRLCLRKNGSRGMNEQTESKCNIHKCPTDGGWTEWKTSKCNKDCGSGVMMKWRVCSKPLPQYGGKTCLKSVAGRGTEEQIELPCNTHKCPIHGGWNKWVMSKCSKKCNGGIMKGKRICQNPSPSHGGELCLKSGGSRGMEEEIERVCNTHKCPIHGGWNKWVMSRCSKKCSGGIMKGKRTCQNPSPSHGGELCLRSDGGRGMEEETERVCNAHKCPVHGGWTEWKASKCNTECGGGTMLKWKFCSKPLPMYGGKKCLMSNGSRGTEELIEKSCNNHKCPIHGGWTDWSMSECSKECGGGRTKGKRLCTNPLPLHGGQSCLKSDGSRGIEESIVRTCNVQKCLVHGKWSAWKEYSACSKLCGGGEQQRRRVCNNPPPQGGGWNCTFSDGNGNVGTGRGLVETQIRSCNTEVCDSSFWNINKIIEDEREIRKNSKVLGPFMMKKQFKVDVQVLINHTTALHDSNVIHFIKNGMKATPSADDTMLGIWFYGPSLIVRARVNRRIVVYESDPIQKNNWIDVSILQIEEFGTHMFTVTLNGLREFVAINKRVDDMEGVTVWASNYWENVQHGRIRRFTYSFP